MIQIFSSHTLEIVKREHLSFFLEKLSWLLLKYSRILKFPEKRPKWRELESPPVARPAHYATPGVREPFQGPWFNTQPPEVNDFLSTPAVNGLSDPTALKRHSYLCWPQHTTETEWCPLEVGGIAASQIFVQALILRVYWICDLMQQKRLCRWIRLGTWS